MTIVCDCEICVNHKDGYCTGKKVHLDCGGICTSYSRKGKGSGQNASHQ